MKILITGASGYIGNRLAHTLAGQGEKVNALIRYASSKELLQHPNITTFKGNVLQEESLMTAMNGCEQVYHMAAMVGLQARDSSVFYDVNVDGTRNVLNAALQSGVEKTVFTSSCGVIGPSLGEPMKENDSRNTSFVIDYDLSKKMAEDLVLQFANKGMNVVIVCPSKVYGPGNTSHSLTANAVIYKFLKSKIAFIPSGTYKVCFAFIDDIVNGHLLAMEKGISGQKYILGGTNISYHEFFDRIRTISNNKGHIIRLRKNFIKAWALAQKLKHSLTGSPVSFTVKSIDHLFSNYTFSSEKAIRDLGYNITSLDEALTETIHFLNNKPHE
jgi:nucleoside-diphosphate-sugar epimerase